MRWHLILAARFVYTKRFHNKIWEKAPPKQRLLQEERIMKQLLSFYQVVNVMLDAVTFVLEGGVGCHEFRIVHLGLQKLIKIVDAPYNVHVVFLLMYPESC